MAQQTFEELVAAVKQAESRGKRYKDDGKTLTTSPKGALGEMQVMPKTILDPGFGVAPAKDKSPDEIARVGVDYLQAMKQKYGDTEKALIAYNWGPGSTDKWLASGADPKKLPAETRTYVERVKGFLGKDVSRETMAKKEREPLPASLPPMAEATPAKAAVMASAGKGMPDIKSMPASYQAAFALAALADAKDEEDDKAYDENKETESEKMMREYKPVNHLASLDLSVTPVMMAEGGDPKSAKSLMDRFKDLAFEYGKDPIAFMRERKVATSPMGLALNASYATYKHVTGKDPLLDLQKELSQRLNPEIDTGDSGSVPISVGLPPIRRADGSPPTGERKLDRETITLMRGEGMQPAAMQRVKPPLELNPSAAGLPGLMMYNDPSLPGTGTAGYVMVGDDNAKNPAMAQAMFLNPKDGNKADTIAHETEHLLARQNLGRGSNINTKFDELIGDNGLKRIQFVQKAVQAAPYLKEKYGLDSAYFKPEMVEFQGRRAKNLLYEQLASLAALEQRHKIDLTKDEELRKTLFARPDVRETYNALTGLRQTRLDPRDLPPHTRVPEPGMLDAIKGVFKRAEGGPVYRANGSPEEGERLTPQQIERIAAQESAEREALSTPAFIAQKSGIGRKAGPVSQALQSGQGQIEFLKGMTNVPQNILGAPMDISNMIANVYGGGVEKPFMGSEYIKEGLRAKGLGFTPSTDPTLAGFYGAGDLGSNLVNPAGATRAGVKAAEKTGEAAKMLARDFQGYNQQLAAPGASYAVRNKGTPVSMSGLPLLPNVDQAEFLVKGVIGSGRKPLESADKSLSDWFSKKVTRYLRSDFATPDDQLVRAAEEGKLLHVAPKEFSDSADDQILKTFLERRQSDLEYMRQAEGFGNTNMARQPYAQRIEDITDISAYPERVGDLTPNRVPPSMRNIVETQPEARVTDYAPGIVQNLKLDELRDKMLEVRQSNSLYGAYGQPAVKIPAEFLLPDKTLTDLNVAAASNRMARYTKWQDETRQRMATTALREDPRFTRAPLQDGKYLGVALPDVRQNPEVKQLVTDVGCDGGWCTRYSQNAKAYGGGFSRLHIMVTGEGKQARPVAQFAVADSGAGFEPSKRFSISEIKEKGNTADFANNPALPAIQEYIQFLEKSYGGLDYVDDLKGLRMTQLPEYPMQLLDLFNPTVQQRKVLEKRFGSEEEGFRVVRDKAVELNKGSRFMTGSEDAVANSLEQAMQLVAGPKENLARRIQMNLFGLPKEKAHGGMIERQPNDNRRYL